MALACMCLCVCVSVYLLTLQRRHCSLIHPNSILNYLVLLSPCVHPIHTNDQNINDTIPRVHCTQGFALLYTELVVHRSANETRKQEIAKPHSILGTFVTCCLQTCYIKGTSTHWSRDFKVFHSSGCCNSIMNAQTTNVILGRNQHIQDEALFSNSLI